MMRILFMRIKNMKIFQIFHEMMSIARVMAYDTPDNAPIQAIYSTRGIETLDISGVYEFEKGKQQVTLKPFENIAAVVEEKFENTFKRCGI